MISEICLTDPYIKDKIIMKAKKLGVPVFKIEGAKVVKT